MQSLRPHQVPFDPVGGEAGQIADAFDAGIRVGGGRQQLAPNGFERRMKLPPLLVDHFRASFSSLMAKRRR